MRSTTTLFTLLTLFAFVACVDDETTIYAPEPTLSVELANYSVPTTESSFFIDESRFNVTDAGATLGRVLFYDKILSRTNKVSCGSCHQQEAGFADPVPFSEGIRGQILSRHTPAISNAYDDQFLFWDGRSGTLGDLALRPVRNHKEMGIDETDFIVAKVKKASYYADLFHEAYGDSEVTEERISDALSQFMASMISGQSKYDKVMAGSATFTDLEQMGQNVFFGEGRCYQCHLGQDFNVRGGFVIDPIFPGGEWGDQRANIGLDEEYTDDGFGTFNAELAGQFKIPTLRNIARTAPYMHDGRFATLEEVIDHYNNNIADHPNLSPELQDWEHGGPARLGLDEIQVQGLIAFLNMLTDEQFLSDSKFSDPFE